ncbi:MAG TPA: type II toxin-antitoxin system mRNA interferase toxin, RelE/StbE family [Candidatus Paceibacterota bacterium]
MKLYFHKKFEKQYKRLRKNEQQRVQERIILFRENRFHPILENHPLQGKYVGHHSINIGGDLRALFKQVGADEYWFVKIGTHSELYE